MGGGGGHALCAGGGGNALHATARQDRGAVRGAPRASVASCSSLSRSGDESGCPPRALALACSSTGSRDTPVCAVCGHTNPTQQAIDVCGVPCALHVWGEGGEAARQHHSTWQRQHTRSRSRRAGRVAAMPALQRKGGTALSLGLDCLLEHAMEVGGGTTSMCDCVMRAGSQRNRGTQQRMRGAMQQRTRSTRCSAIWRRRRASKTCDSALRHSGSSSAGTPREVRRSEWRCARNLSLTTLGSLASRDRAPARCSCVLAPACARDGLCGMWTSDVRKWKRMGRRATVVDARS